MNSSRTQANSNSPFRRLPLVCNRTGAILTAETPLDAQYWRRHSRQPVQFAESVRTVAALGCSVLMEIGPQPVLTGAALQVWPEHLAAPRAIVSLRKGVGDRGQIADAFANAYVSGHRPTFAALHQERGRKLELPTYPFQRRRFWPKSSAITVDGPAMSGLLGSGKDLASGDCVYTSRLSVKSQPWLSDHVIYGTVVVPGATYAAMALAAVGAPAHVKRSSSTNRSSCRRRLLVRCSCCSIRLMTATAGNSRCTAARTVLATLSGR